MMNLFKPLLSVQQQLQILPKFYRSHIWITPPGSDGLSFLGISDYAKKHFVRLKKLDFQTFPKTNYGLTNRQRIRLFIEDTKSKRQQGQLCLAQEIQWQRFMYKQGQAFVTLQTMEFDVELQAPVDMRVVEIQYNCYFYQHLISSSHFFKVEAFNPEDISLLDTEDKYLKARKLIF